MLLLSLCALSVISPQLVHHSLIMGADSLFHFNRFYDAASQINDHNWQYFVSMYGFSQSGRIVNALYGPFIAYFNGFILGLTHSWFSYQIISDFIVLFVSGISMYYLLIQNYVSKQYQVVISILYMLSYGVVTWVIGQQFLSWGAAILPLGVSVATRFVREKNAPVNIIEMTLSVTLMIQTHVLSSLLLISLLSIFFATAFFQTANRKALFNNTMVAALLTVLLTANIWGVFLEVYSTNDLLPPFHNATPQTRGSVSFPLDNLKLFFPYALLYGCQIIILIRHWHHLEMVNRLVTLVGSIYLTLTLSIFPWDVIFKLPFISMLQLPYRLLPTRHYPLITWLRYDTKPSNRAYIDRHPLAHYINWRTHLNRS